MKSSEGVHFVGLDHVRALAIFLVFAYHFVIAASGVGAHLPGSLSLPVNALVVEGQTGVALFMTLSGYLFSRLAEGREIDFTAFRYNRFLRLAPLLGIVFVLVLIEVAIVEPRLLREALSGIVLGFALPSWPNGGWSIAVEMHFYLLFPVLLALLRRDWRLLLLVPLIGVALRCWIYFALGGVETQVAAYWTIIGRMDQFVLGMLAARGAAFFAGRHRLALGIGLTWIALWHGFALLGGYYELEQKWLWIVLPTAEGAAYGALIAWYDRSFRMAAGGVSGFIGKIGEWSFSIYLLHFFFVERMARAIDTHVVALDNFYLALLFALPCFLAMCAIASLSYRWLEMPFLRWRVSYFKPRGGRETAAVVQPA